MRRHRWNLVAGLICVFLSTVFFSAVLPAGERYLDFVQGLRDRNYFDTAIEYLERLDQLPGVPADIKAVIPFEKASTLTEQAKTTRNPEIANQLLDRSAEFLTQFLKDNPNHPLAARANADAATVLLNKGKVSIFQSRSPANAQKKGELLKQAQASFTQAKAMFDKAYEQHLAAYNAFPPFIDETKEAKQFAERAASELAYIRARLDAAIVMYEAAQAYERDSAEFKSSLIAAAQKFEEITSKHRTQVAGLMAQMYTAKCFEELGDLQKALGIYNDLLRNPGESATMRNLQGQVTHFKLICLNTEGKADYKLVDQLASEWMKENQGLVRTKSGIGIRYEQARALEQLSKERIPETEKRGYLTAALDGARQVNRFGGEYRDLSQAMMQRLNAALNRDGSDPKDFDTAYGVAREMVGRISELNGKIKGAADKAARDAAEQEFQRHLTETARMLNLALQLRKANSKLIEVNYSRYALSHVYYLQKRYYEAAVMGEFVARRYATDEESGAVPLDAAYLAMAAYNGAYRQKTNPDKDTDIRRMIDVCNFIASHWPDSPRAVEAYIMLGGLYRVLKQPVEAAKWFAKVPESSNQYLTAQIDAGQAYWGGYLEALTKPAEERPDAAALSQMQTNAQTILKNAITKLEAGLAEGSPLPENIAFAKLTLAQMANATGQYAEALKLLETDKRAALTATVIKEGEPRPKIGITSAAAVTEIYKQILRAYIGLQDLEKARGAMNSLEKIATGQGQDILPIYVSLGKQFKEEIDRLGKSDKAKYEATLKSFESFLGNMLARKEGQNYSSYVWIGEMYIALGEGVTDPAAGQRYFAEGTKAFQEIVDKAQADSSFASEQQTQLAQSRLALCLRKSGEFEKAAELVQSLLKKNANQLDFQIEAANLYQDWGASGRAESAKQWDIALKGASIGGQPLIWGWFTLAKKIANQIAVDEQAGRKPSERHYEILLDASYNIAWSRHKSALAKPEKEKMADLMRAQADIVQASIQYNMDDPTYEKFNTLYKENKEAMGLALEELPRNPEPVEVATTETNTSVSPGDSTSSSTASSTKSKSSKSSKKKKSPAETAGAAESSALMMFGGILAVAAVAGAGWFIFGRKKQQSAVLAKAMSAQAPATAMPPKNTTQKASPSKGTAKSATPKKEKE